MEPDPLRRLPTQPVPETTADIGSLLRAARLKKGHSLEAVGQHTRIPKKFLEAMEANRISEFPALAYLRGFLKNYCDYLELEFEPIWKLIVPAPGPGPAGAPPEAEPQRPPAAAPRQSPAAAPARRPPDAHGSATAHGSPPAHGTPAGRAGDSEALPSAAGSLILSAFLAVLLAVWVLHSDKKPRNQAPEDHAPPTALEPLQGPVEPLLTIEYRREAWASVSLDARLRFEGRVPKNARQEWKAKKSITLRLSDPQAVKLTLNGSPALLPAPDEKGLYQIESPSL